MTKWKKGDRAMVEIAGFTTGGLYCTLKGDDVRGLVDVRALHPLPPHVAASDAALADATEAEARMARNVLFSHDNSSAAGFRVALNGFISSRRAAIPETTRKESLHVPSEAAAPTPDLAALERAVVEAAMAWRKKHNNPPTKDNFHPLGLVLAQATDALRAAREPVVERDAVEELVEAAKNMIKTAWDVSDTMSSENNDLRSAMADAACSLRAAIARLRETGR